MDEYIPAVAPVGIGRTAGNIMPTRYGEIAAVKALKLMLLTDVEG